MNGHKGKYFLLMLSFIGWMIVGTLTFGIAYLWITPYYTASLASFYESLVKKNQEKTTEF